MFYSNMVLAKSGALANIWLAAHLSKKLSKTQIFDTDISKSVGSIKKPEVTLALRVQGHLLLGVVRIYSKKIKYLFADCNYARSSLSREYSNANVDLPTDVGTASINLAGGFGNFDEDDDEAIMYTAPNVKRWATLAVYQAVDEEDEQDDEEEETGTGRGVGLEQGDEPSFTTFGPTGMGSFASFGQGDESAFDIEVPEVARAIQDASRQSEAFSSSPVAAGEDADAPASSTAPAKDSLFAPVDDSFNLGGDEQPEERDPFFEREEEEDPNAGLFNASSTVKEADALDEAEEEEGVVDPAPGSQSKKKKRRRTKVKFDEQTTLSRKALKMKPNTLATDATRVQDRQLQVWQHTHRPAYHPATFSQARLNTEFLRPASGIAAPALLRMFATCIDGARRAFGGESDNAGTTGARPKRGHAAIAGGADDDDDVEVARRRTEGEFSLQDASSFGFQGGDEIMEEREEEEDGNASMSFALAPVDEGMSFGASSSEGPHNAALERALRSHQMGATQAEGEEDEEADSRRDSGEGGHNENGDGSSAEEKMHPRTLVMMREINRQLGEENESENRSNAGGARKGKAANQKTLQFGQMIAGFGKAPAAAAFFEILALKTRGYIDIQQRMPFSDITVSSTDTFVDPTHPVV